MTPSCQTSWNRLPHVLRFLLWPSVSPSPPSCPLRGPLSFSCPPLSCSRKAASHLRHCSLHSQNYFLRYFHCCFHFLIHSRCHSPHCHSHLRHCSHHSQNYFPHHL